jgi:hypothetical protein
LEVLGLVFVGLVPQVDEFFFERGEDGCECFDGFGSERLLVGLVLEASLGGCFHVLWGMGLSHFDGFCGCHVCRFGIGMCLEMPGLADKGIA